MRLLTTLTTAAAILFAAHPSAAQTAPDFGPLASLVGHCWIGTFPSGKETDEHCFEWIFDRKFIRDRHVVRNGAGPYSGETIYAWDAKQKRPTWWYINSEGQTILGTVEFTADGIVFPSHYETDKGTVEIKAVWSSLSPGGYRVAQSQRNGAEWKTQWTMQMKRR